MRYSILFVAVLISVSGFIAYFGDVLGRWMGKKRLTLLRMRPRHTAYAVTAVTGMLIAGLTLATLITVNTDFNRLWNEGDRILTQNKTLSHEKRKLTKVNKSLDDRSAELQRLVAKKQREVDEAEEAALKAAEAQTKAVEARDKAVKTVARLEKDITAKTRQLAVLRQQGADAREEARRMTVRLDGLKEQLRSAQAAIPRAQKNVADAVARQRKVQESLRATNEQLDTARKLLDEQQKAIAAQQDVIAKQQGVIVRQLNKISEIQNEASKFQSALVWGDIRFRQGDEIARGTVSPTQSLFGIRGDLYSLLDVAGGKAIKSGAGSGPNGRAVVVAQPYAGVTEGQPEVLSESARVDLAANSIAASALGGWETLVQVVCAGNSLAGEQAPVMLVLHYNNMVYRKGDLIASTNMDGRVSEGRVQLAVIGFLQNEVSRAGLKAGIVPVSNPDPRASLGSDPRVQVEGLMSVVNQVKAKNARVKVEAYACADIYAIGPLNMVNMRFSVTKD